MKMVKWVGSPPDSCELCGEPFTTVFIDGRTRHYAWCLMCPLCHTEAGTGLGTGKGQKYEKQGSEWIKTQG